MALTLVATAGSASANSYATVVQADAYADSHPYLAAAWSDISDDEDKLRALMEATRRIDDFSPAFVGRIATTTQALAWPRAWVRDPRQGTVNAPANWTSWGGIGVDLTAYLDSTTIPAPIVHACCELAGEIVRGGTTDPWAAPASQNVKRKETGPLVTEYFAPGTAPRGAASYSRVMALLAPFLASGARVVRC